MLQIFATNVAGLVAQSLNRSRPAYTLSDTDGNGGKDIVTAPDRGFTDATELPIDKPNRSVTVGEIFAYSERDGGQAEQRRVAPGVGLSGQQLRGGVEHSQAA